MEGSNLDGGVVNHRQRTLHTIFTLPILEQLAQSEQWRAFPEQLRHNTSCAEDVHRFRHPSYFTLTACTRTLNTGSPSCPYPIRLCTRSVEPLRRNITRSPPRSIEEE